MKFGQRVRALRQERGLSQRALASLIGINFTYVSKIENERLDFGEYPSEVLICRIAAALGVDGDELLILAKKIPEQIRQRVFQRPDVFRALARCDDETLDGLLANIARGAGPKGQPIRRTSGGTGRRGRSGGRT